MRRKAFWFGSVQMATIIWSQIWVDRHHSFHWILAYLKMKKWLSSWKERELFICTAILFLNSQRGNFSPNLKLSGHSWPYERTKLHILSITPVTPPMANVIRVDTVRVKKKKAVSNQKQSKYSLQTFILIELHILYFFSEMDTDSESDRMPRSSERR